MATRPTQPYKPYQPGAPLKPVAPPSPYAPRTWSDQFSTPIHPMSYMPTRPAPAPVMPQRPQPAQPATGSNFANLLPNEQGLGGRDNNMAPGYGGNSAAQPQPDSELQNALRRIQQYQNQGTGNNYANTTQPPAGGYYNPGANGGNQTPGGLLQQLQDQANLANEQRYAELLRMTTQNGNDRLSALGGISNQMQGQSQQNLMALLGLNQQSSADRQNLANNVLAQSMGASSALGGQLQGMNSGLLQQLLGANTNLGNSLMGMNSTLGNQLSGLNSASDAERRAGFNNNWQQIMGLAGGGIDSALQREQRRRDSELGASSQSAISRGLGNTTVADSLRRGVVDDSALREQGIYDAAQQQKLGLLQNYGSQQDALLSQLGANQYNTAAGTGTRGLGIAQSTGNLGINLAQLFGNQGINLAQNAGNQQLNLLQNYGNQGDARLRDSLAGQSGALSNYGNQQMGILSGLNNDTQNILSGNYANRANIIQSRTDAAPDLGLYAQLLSQPGAAQGMQTASYTQGGTNTPMATGRDGTMTAGAPMAPTYGGASGPPVQPYAPPAQPAPWQRTLSNGMPDSRIPLPGGLTSPAPQPQMTSNMSRPNATGAAIPSGRNSVYSMQLPGQFGGARSTPNALAAVSSRALGGGGRVNVPNPTNGPSYNSGGPGGMFRPMPSQRPQTGSTGPGGMFSPLPTQDPNYAFQSTPNAPVRTGPGTLFGNWPMVAAQ